VNGVEHRRQRQREDEPEQGTFEDEARAEEEKESRVHPDHEQPRVESVRGVLTDQQHGQRERHASEHRGELPGPAVTPLLAHGVCNALHTFVMPCPGSTGASARLRLTSL